jgi:hypothetical protein
MRFVRSPRVPVLFALPTGMTSADHGREIKYVADQTAGVTWDLIYRHFQSDGVTVNPSAYKWEFVGGSPLFAEHVGDVTTTSSVYALSTVTVGVTVPSAGEYMLEFEAQMWNSVAGNGVYLGVGFNAAPVGGTNNDVVLTAPGANYIMSGKWGPAKRAATAGQQAQLWIATSANAGSFRNRKLAVRPVRVG